MTDSAISSQSSETGLRSGTSTKKRIASEWLPLLAAISGVAGQLLFSNDWCLYTVPAFFLAALLCWLIVAFCSLISRSGRPPGWKSGSVLAIVTGLGCGAAFRVIPSWAFAEAFGVDQPSGIRDLHIWRHYEGGPGEHSLIFEFNANEDAISTLTGPFPKPAKYSPYPTRWDEVVQKQGESNAWMAAYEIFGGAYHTNGRKAWSQLNPMHDPQIFFAPASQQNRGRSILVLWERASGRTIAFHSRG